VHAFGEFAFGQEDTYSPQDETPPSTWKEKLQTCHRKGLPWKL